MAGSSPAMTIPVRLEMLEASGVHAGIARPRLDWWACMEGNPRPARKIFEGRPGGRSEFDSDVQNGKPRSYRLEFSTNREATTVAGILRRSSASTLWSPIAAPQSTRPVRPSRPNTCPDRLHPRALTRPRPRTRSGAGSLPLALERFQALTSGQPPSFRGRQASSAGVVVITLATSQGCLLSAGVFAWNR